MYLYIHRKDLRSADLRAFDAIANRGGAGLHIIILDDTFIQQDRLQTFSGQTFVEGVARLQTEYQSAGKTLHILAGQPTDIVERLLTAHPIAGIIVQADFTPYARQRDEQLEQLAQRYGRGFKSFDDVPMVPLAHFNAFAKRTEPYKVFTPFYKMWSSYVAQHYEPSARTTIADLQTVDELDLDVAEQFALPANIANQLAEAQVRLHASPAPLASLRTFTDGAMSDYNEQRNVYANPHGSSGIAKWLNSGVISARQAYEVAQQSRGAAHAEPWIRQLAWRDFYLYQARQNPDYFTYEQRFDLSALDDRHFAAWCNAETGIPVIDAAMTQLNTTGDMPNRLRMVVAMFLSKNLLCPFTLGEQYFRNMLNDYDNTLNRGGWLWSSSFGYDAAPYFRIMNPVTQSETHDPSGDYIRRWLPQLSHLSNKQIHAPRPHAIVDLKSSRATAIEVYKTILR